MENTIDNHKKFRAQYISQKVLRSKNGVYIQELTFRHLMNSQLVNGTYLELIPLSMISDEDSKQIVFRCPNIIGLGKIITGDTINSGKDLIENYEKINLLQHLPSGVIDFLRSKNYAVPYNDLLVEQQIEYGWIKLKTK